MCTCKGLYHACIQHHHCVSCVHVFVHMCVLSLWLHNKLWLGRGPLRDFELLTNRLCDGHYFTNSWALCVWPVGGMACTHKRTTHTCGASLCINYIQDFVTQPTRTAHVACARHVVTMGIQTVELGCN